MARSLSAELAGAAFDVLMRGEATPVETAALLMALRVKGETADEVAGAGGGAASRHGAGEVGRRPAGGYLRNRRRTGGHAQPVHRGRVRRGRRGCLRWPSTAIAASPPAAGRPTCSRHWASISALPPSRAPEVFRAAGLVFLFAPTYHPAMRHVGPVRRGAGRRHDHEPARTAGESRRRLAAGDRRLGSRTAPRSWPRRCSGSGRSTPSCCTPTSAWTRSAPRGPTMSGRCVTARCDRWRRASRSSTGLDCDELEQLAGGEPAENARRIEELLAGDGSLGGALRGAAERGGGAVRGGRGGNLRQSRGAGGGGARERRGPCRAGAAAPRRPASGQYFRMTPTTMPWISTSRSWKRMGCMVVLAGCRRIQPPGSR